MNNQSLPDLIFVLSGKRKSGKDYVCERISSLIKEKYLVKCITLSSPLKEAYAQENGLDYEKLLDSSDYKEKYRCDMIKWGELKRDQDPGYFCRKAIEKALASKEQGCQRSKTVWIVTDARRKTDIEYFRQNYPSDRLCLVRVTAEECVRKCRNWKFTQGVDDAPSECDLDLYKGWDVIIKNNNDCELEKSVTQILQRLKQLDT